MSYYPVELDKVRNFKFGMRAISSIEKKFKKPISQIDLNGLTMEETATFIWAGLVHEDKNLTPERVMDLIDEYSSLPKITKVMQKAFIDAFGGDEVAEESEEKEVKNE